LVLRIEVVEREGALGAVATRDGREAGRLLALPLEDDVRGHHVWSGLDDHGLADREEPELYRDLYAVAGQAWVDVGRPAHYVVVPADEAVLVAWYGLCFAQQQVHAARPLEASSPPEPEGFDIRLGGPEDLDAAVSLGDLITAYQRGAPVWSGVALPSAEELRSGWAEFLAVPGTTLFMAERDGEPLGYVALRREDDETVELPIAGTRPETRGVGVGVALTEHALAWAYEQGFRACTIDWRAANLLASRFWPRRGFRPTAYRLVRVVSP
jgi:ribosomal protein S18 acetylase RimI-like enzyme